MCATPRAWCGYQQKMLKALWKSGRKAMQVLETMRNVSEYTFLISGLRLTITDDVNLTGI
jgi:hypothetical protein